jgi:hypothetical protein
MGLSIGAKLRVIVGGMLVAWILLISFPIATITTVSSAVAGLQLNNAQNTPGVQLIRNPSTSGGRELVAYGVASVTPVPTKTPLPIKTATPKPTSAPAPKVVVPTKAPVAAALPPTPSAPPLVLATIDKRLGPGGIDHMQNVRIAPASVPSGQKFWHITKIDFENGVGEAFSGCGDHNIKVIVLDQYGKRYYGTKLSILGGSPSPYYEPEKPPSDAEGACGFNFSYVTGGGEYSAALEDQYPSDKATGLKGLPMNQHVSFLITFKLTTQP